jgi:hypothetical protein
MLGFFREAAEDHFAYPDIDFVGQILTRVHGRSEAPALIPNILHL